MLDNDTEPLPLAPLLAAAPRIAYPPEPLPARIAQGFARWLPILLMALLALVTFWLVRQSAPVAVDKPSAAPSHAPDYEMKGFSIEQHGVAGATPSVIEGDQVQHYPDTDTFDITDVRLRWVDLQGRVTLITARRASFAPALNQVVLLENGHLARPTQQGVDDGLELWGDQLVFDTEAQTVRSKRPVVVRYGAHRFEGGGVTYDHRGGLLNLTGGVHGEVQLRRR